MTISSMLGFFGTPFTFYTIFRILACNFNNEATILSNSAVTIRFSGCFIRSIDRVCIIMIIVSTRHCDFNYNHIT